jgi:hypothetical protein
MAERPNVIGKGPAMLREMAALCKEIEGNQNGLPADAVDKVKAAMAKCLKLEPMAVRPYVKTVKGAEVIWDCKEMASQLQQAVQAGDAGTVSELAAGLEEQADWLNQKISTFVVRMT